MHSVCIIFVDNSSEPDGDMNGLRNIESEHGMAVARWITTLWMLTIVCHASAQRKGIVIDASTKQPLRNVFVKCDNDSTIKTPWDGTFQLPENFQTVAFYHPNFEKRVLNHKELTDTVFMLPSARMLNEVVVYGKRGKIRDFTRMTTIDKQLLGIKPTNGFDILGLLKLITNPIQRSIEHKKEVKKQKRKQILDNY